MLVEAKTGSGVLKRLAYLSRWIEQAHQEQLRLEALVQLAHLQGAAFTQREQEEALASDTPSYLMDLLIRSGSCEQPQILTAGFALFPGTCAPPVTADLVFGIHRRNVKGCDDDHF